MSISVPIIGGSTPISLPGGDSQGPPLDPNFLVEMVIPLFREEVTSIIGVSVRAATLLFGRRAAAPIAILISQGLPKDLHVPDLSDTVIPAIVGRVTSGMASVFRLAMLAEQRARMLAEADTPELTKEALKGFIQKELRSKAGLYIMTPLRELLDGQGRYGKYIGAVVTKLLNPDIIINLVLKIIDGI